MISRDKDIVLDRDSINDCITQFNLEAPRLLKLHRYSVGLSDIVDRTRYTGLPNNLLMHAYPSYIATMTSGYLIGDPVQYVSEEPGLEAVTDAYDSADVGSIDSEIALCQAIFGRGCELVYANDKAEPRTTAIDPQNAFVVYADDAEGLPLFGVYRLVGVDSKGKSYTKRIYVYTAKEIIEYDADSNGLAGIERLRTPHNFPYVPLVEYWNNSSQTGDFEQVISLIDAYDILESDRVNDKEQFANSILVLKGVVGLASGAEGDTRTTAQRVRQEGAIAFNDAGAGAEYLTKALDEEDTDVLRKAIKGDIHKFSHVPDITDENFSGNSSGVAMKYKLLGLEQLTKIKERWFREGLRWRLRLFAGFLSLKGKPSLDADKVQMMFRRSLPVNDLEIAQTIQMLQGIVPDNILLAQVPFIDNVQQARDDLAEQKQNNIAAQAAAFGAFPAAKDEDTEVT